MPDPPESEKQQAYRERVLALLPRRERDLVRDLLLSLDTASFPLLTKIITREQEKRRKNSWAFPFILLLPSLIAALFWPFSLPLMGIVFLLIYAVQIYLPVRLEKAAWEILMHTESEQSIGPLLETLKRQTGSMRAKTKRRLVPLLPHLTPPTFLTFNQTQRNTLYSLLHSRQLANEQELRLAVLAALQQAGDLSCLGHVYVLTLDSSNYPTAFALREAAKPCLADLLTRLDFGPLETLPHYIDAAYHQMTAEEPNLSLYFTSLLILRQLLPQLAPSNYQNILSDTQRLRLYSLARLRMLHPLFRDEIHHPDRRATQLEIVHTAERLGDTSALGSLEAFVRDPPPFIDSRVKAAVLQAVEVLKPLAEYEKLGRTLLRGASAPETMPDELLRAVTGNASETDPHELLRPHSGSDTKY
ncbi:MAG: hypothetical protein JWN14_2272 [Chthonomonadales bacterium]|nr:hypothetical protein [Chthonomonadales bacterium]